MIAQTRKSPLPIPGTQQRFVSAEPVRPNSYNPKTRSVQATLATSFPVKRSRYTEVLVIDQAAIDLTRVELGVCRVLDSHRSGSIADAIGTVSSAWIEQGELVGQLQFADTPGGRAAEESVAKGHINAVSVGFSILAARMKEHGEHEQDDIVEVTRWALLEVSCVTVPADPTARIRQHQSIPPILADTRMPQISDDIVSLRLAVIAADERHGELFDQWHDNTEASGLRPDNEEVEAAEDDLDAAKARLERAERRERAIQQAMKR